MTASTERLITVGIGTSAGGVSALKRLLAHMPEDLGMAIVIVIHLADDTASTLPHLLGRQTDLPVKQIEDGDSLAVNSVFVGPPGSVVGLDGTVFHLERQEDGGRAPINSFFRSLAASDEVHPIGIVLTGMGSDGSLGLQEIRAAGGLTFVQNPLSAEYPSMPQSAADLSVIDQALELDEIPRTLADYRTYFSKDRRERLETRGEKSEKPIRKILAVVRKRTGHDFGQYKLSTLERRIRRRMSVHRLSSYEEYLEYLRRHREEADHLLSDALIGVTSFFRDEQAFAALRDTGLPELLRDGERERLRIWVPACSTGEEAYTIAVLVREYLEQHDLHLPTTIFATDVNGDSITRARKGEYPASAAADIPDRYLGKWVDRTEDVVRVDKAIREMLVFSVQNLVDDPPFTSIDLISCRNLLIYLNHDVQSKVVQLLHYSLTPGGMLLLGSSETVRSHGELFDIVHKSGRLYRARARHTSPRFGFGTSAIAASPDNPEREARMRPLQSRIKRYLLARAVPPTVFVNDQYRAEFFHGRTAEWLEPPTGEPNMDVLEMARNGLKIPLRQLLVASMSSGSEVSERGIRVHTDGDHRYVDVTVSPVPKGYNLEGLWAVSFAPGVEVQADGGKPEATDQTPSAESELVRQLQEELQITRERLQSTIEQLETSNEELKSSVEEYQSTNEELQSSNEELESSKEEMQSLNEELTTVNSELYNKNEELEESYEEMQNFLDSLDIPIVFVDENLRVKRFTKAISRVISLTPVDINRSITDISMAIGSDRLIGKLREVIDESEVREWTVESNDGVTYLIRARPYTDVNRVRVGVLVSFLPQAP